MRQVLNWHSWQFRRWSLKLHQLGERRVTKSRLDGADGLRAFACLLVVFHHISHQSSVPGVGPGPDWLVPFVSNGGYGVVIFFVLSGFLLGRPFWVALDAGDRYPSIRTYLLRRFARITPGFLVALTGSLIIALLYGQTTASPDTALRFFLGATYLSAFVPFAIFPVEVNGPLWSISYEVWAYLFMPLAFLLIFATPTVRSKTVGRWALWLAVILAAVLLHIAYMHFVPKPDRPDFLLEEFTLRRLGDGWAQRFSVFGMFAIFAIGVLAAAIQFQCSKFKGMWADVVALACLTVAIWICFDFGRPGNPTATMDGVFGLPYNQFPLFPALVGGFLATAPSSRFVGSLLDIQPMRYLSTISFGIYIYHMPLLFIVSHALFGPDQIAQTDADIAMMTGILLAATIAVAHLSWHRLEKPAIEWARQLERRKPREGARKEAF